MPASSLAIAQASCPESVDVTNFYQRLQVREYQFGNAFIRLMALWRGDGEAVGKLRWDRNDAGWMPPGMLDGLFQLLYAIVPEDVDLPTIIPYAVERLRLLEMPAGEVWGHAQVSDSGGDGQTIRGDLRLYDESGYLLLELSGLRGRRSSKEALLHMLRVDDPRHLGDLAYKVNWQKAESSPPPVPLVGDWLIVPDKAGVGVAVAKQLEAGGARVWLAESTEVIGERAYAGILYLPGLDGDVASACHPLIDLVQMAQHPTKLWLVTANGQKVLASDQVKTADSGVLWGFGATIANERQELWGGLLDIEWGEVPAMATAILSCLAQGVEGERVAWREGERYVARLEGIRATGAGATDESPLFDSGTVLVTGGLGALGWQLAAWLVGQGVQHLALAGRTPPSPQQETGLAEWREAGVMVLYLPMDVSDGESVAKGMVILGEKMPALTGLFHLAGVLDDALLKDESIAHFKQVIAPKWHGAWHLHQATQEMGLRHFVLFGSAAGVLGTPGQASYSAGNMGMATLAHYRHGLGLPALCINWGAWGEVGMAAEMPAEAQRWANWGIESLSIEQGLAALAWALGQAETAELLIMGMDRERLLQMTGDMPFLATLSNGAVKQKGDEAKQFRAELEAVVPAERRVWLMARLADEVRQILGMGRTIEVDVEQPLNELGMDSLMAVELRNKLMQVAGKSLPVTLLFDYPTLATMADYLLAEWFLFEDEEKMPAQSLPVDVEADERTSEVTAMSDEEAEAALAKALEGLT